MYRLAAAQGTRRCPNGSWQHVLCLGEFVPQDYAEAFKLYRLAAAQGQGRAQNNLAVMYAKGQVVAQDYIEAHKWYNLAATHSPTAADRELAITNRDSIASTMTPAQVAEAQKRARDWKASLSIV